MDQIEIQILKGLYIGALSNEKIAMATGGRLREAYINHLRGLGYIEPSYTAPDQPGNAPVQIGWQITPAGRGWIESYEIDRAEKRSVKRRANLALLFSGAAILIALAATILQVMRIY